MSVFHTCCNIHSPNVSYYLSTFVTKALCNGRKYTHCYFVYLFKTQDIISKKYLNRYGHF